MSRFRSHWLAGGLFAAGCSLLNSGCAETSAERADAVPPTVRLMKLPPNDPANKSSGADTFALVPIQPAQSQYEKGIVALTASAAPATKPTDRLVPVAYQPAQPEKIAQLPAPRPLPAEDKIIPVSLDTVFRLAEEQNPQIALAREKLNESETEQSLAAKAWLPKVFAGASYYRHEGGIQNEDGSLQHSSTGALFKGVDLHGEFDVREATFLRVSAERKAIQQRGELSKVTSETLLEAATTYLDLLTARRGEAVAHELEKYLLDIKERAEKLVTPDDRSAQVLVEAARAEATGRRQTILKLHQQGDAAAAKLAYLLGLGSCVKMVPVEETLTPIDLIDPTQPTCDLVAQSLENGPGVRELQHMLAVMQEGLDRANGLRYAPIVSLSMEEGAFASGPGGNLTYDNRWDTTVRVRWNLTDLLTANEKRHVAESRIEQARLTYEDLRGKLTAGVQEARDASLSGREQVRMGAEQIQHAAEGYRLSDERLKMRAPNASPADVLLAIRGLEAAHFNHLTAINAYNKAQIRLLVLLGPAATQSGKGDAHGHPAHGRWPLLPAPVLRPELP